MATDDSVLASMTVTLPALRGFKQATASSLPRPVRLLVAVSYSIVCQSRACYSTYGVAETGIAHPICLYT